MVLLSRVLGTCVAACQSRRQRLQQAHRISPVQLAARLGRPGWLEDAEARSQIEAMLQARAGSTTRRVQAVRSAHIPHLHTFTLHTPHFLGVSGGPLRSGPGTRWPGALAEPLWHHRGAAHGARGGGHRSRRERQRRHRRLPVVVGRLPVVSAGSRRGGGACARRVPLRALPPRALAPPRLPDGARGGERRRGRRSALAAGAHIPSAPCVTNARVGTPQGGGPRR